MSITPMRILVVYFLPEKPEHTRLSIIQHLHAMETSETKHNLVYYNAWNDAPPISLEDTKPQKPPLLDGSHFHAVIFHNTFLGNRWNYWYFYVFQEHFNWLKELDCVKIAMPQDEYDHAELLDEWLFDYGVSTIFSLHDENTRRSLYPLMRGRARFVKCFAGYIDEEAASKISPNLPSLDKRPFDVVYRATHLPYWFGSAGQLKHRIADVVAHHASKHNLRCNISTKDEDVIVSSEWLDFLSSGRATIGCESGSSVLDWRGEIQTQIRTLQRIQQDISFEEVHTQMPEGWDSHSFFAISPRHFEAVITKTCQVLVEGYYDGVLEADTHYIPIKRDFSNIDEALEKIRDDTLVNQIVERAYQDIYLSGKYSYRAFARQIEDVIVENEIEGKDEEVAVATIRNSYEKERALEGLERQLVAERHKYSLLEAKLVEAKLQKSELQSQLQQHKGELQTQLQQQFGELYTQLRVKRKKALFFCVLIGIVSAILSVPITLLLLFVLGIL